MNLGLPKAFIQLFHMQVHIPYIQARCDIPFQIRFCDFSGVLSHSQTTCSKVAACNLKDCNPHVQSQQFLWFNVIIGNNREFGQYKSLLYNFHSNLITMGFPALMKSDKCFIGTILSSMIINGFFDIQQGPERSKYFVRS